MNQNLILSRRRLLGLLGGAAVTSLFSPNVLAHNMAGMNGTTDIEGPGKWALPAMRKVKLAVNLNAICIAPVTVADKQGFFRQHNLDVEFVNFGNSTELLLESIATGKADAAVGMALRWLKALEQGFDVKLTAGTHGGCMRLVTLAQGPQNFADLKGKTIGVTDMAAADKNFFSLLLKRHGIDPVNDVSWRAYPLDLLPMALQKGEIQAASGSDPVMWRLINQSGYRELATNLTDEYANLSCCVVGVRGALTRDDPAVAAAITHAILQAHAWAAKHPDEIGDEFVSHALNTTAQEISAVLQTHTHGHSATGDAFVKELAVYARDLKAINVLRPDTDPQLFARGITANVFA
ncbi:ABC transporter substrate-binding protein [Pantoea sp. CCBC3-3-1]|uniref:ABC transporter substrate-binding protein n=1 Tax=Pantoea sp. CCBC3-3-1 TaxID=2490851 RepID=UPI0020C56635|nr:ABC transporter substrate-binding protein [Pantoea sp. CCBC3-3-1]